MGFWKWWFKKNLLESIIVVSLINILVFGAWAFIIFGRIVLILIIVGIIFFLGLVALWVYLSIAIIRLRYYFRVQKEKYEQEQRK